MDQFILSGLHIKPFYLTFKQAIPLGGRVRKGAKSIPMTYWNFKFSPKETQSTKEVIPVMDVVQSSFFDPGLQYSFHLSMNASFCSLVSVEVSRCHFLRSDQGFLLPPIPKPKRILLNINNAIACQRSMTLRFAALAIE